jgi:hypothetical protein
LPGVDAEDSDADYAAPFRVGEDGLVNGDSWRYNKLAVKADDLPKDSPPVVQDPLAVR